MSEQMEYPPTPDLAAGFWERLAEAEERRRLAWRPLAALGAASLAIVVLLVAAVAPAREAAADLFDRINIFEVDEDAFESITRDIVGEDVTLAEAEVRLGQEIALPDRQEGIQNSITRVVYRDFRGTPAALVAISFEPDEGAPFVLFATNTQAGKGLGPLASAERVAEMNEAYWLEGLRIVELQEEGGGPIEESQRVTDANTLIWVHEDGYVYRIEGEMDRDQAIEIARSVR